MKDKALIALLFILVVFAGGCWNRRDPELLGYVIATGFDYNEEEEFYHIIAQVARPVALQEQNGAGGGNPDRPPFWVISADGRTPFKAKRNLAEGSSRELFWGHNRLLLFSETLARRGIQPVLDLFFRSRQLRLIARPLVVDGDLYKLMTSKFPLEEMGGEGLVNQIEAVQRQKSMFPPKFTTELYNLLAQPGVEVFIGEVQVLVEEEDDREEEDSNQENGMNAGEIPPARIGGGAAFHDDQMVDWISRQQAIGWMHTTGRAMHTNHVIEVPGQENEFLSIEVFVSQSEMRPVGTEKEPGIALEVTAEGRIMDVPDPGGLDREDFIQSIERRMAESIHKEIEDLIKRTHELNSDIVGFGNLLYREKPQIWAEIGNDWEEIFPELTVDLSVEFELQDAGLAGDPVGSGGRER